jgi:hypothetical protein
MNRRLTLRRENELRAAGYAPDRRPLNAGQALMRVLDEQREREAIERERLYWAQRDAKYTPAHEIKVDLRRKRTLLARCVDAAADWLGYTRRQGR